MIQIEAKLDDLLGKWKLSDEEGPIESGSDGMSDLVSDIMRVVRENLADSVANYIEGQLGG